MTAHWGIPDPAAVAGTEVEQRLGVRRCAADVDQSHQHLCRLAAPVAERADTAKAARCDRQNQGLQRQSGLDCVMTEVPSASPGDSLPKAWAPPFWSRPSSARGSWRSASRAVIRRSRCSATRSRPARFWLSSSRSSGRFRGRISIQWSRSCSRCAERRPGARSFPTLSSNALCGIAGTVIAHLMFDLAPLVIGTTGAERTRALAWRGRGHVHARPNDPGWRAIRAASDSLAGRLGDHRSLLVHVLDVVRQPSRDTCAWVHDDVRRDRHQPRPGVHCRPSHRRHSGDNPRNGALSFATKWRRESNDRKAKSDGARRVNPNLETRSCRRHSLFLLSKLSPALWGVSPLARQLMSTVS